MLGLFAMARIESVIFDWGGVLIDDPAPGRMRYCAEALGVSAEDLAGALNELIVDFQRGLINEATFWERLCGQMRVPVPKGGSLWADGFRAAYVPREDVFSLAACLRRTGCKTAVLSNTEAPAMEYFGRLGYDMFDVLVFSCAEGIIKPERRIYEITLEKLDSQAGQTVFIDDKAEYINGAKGAGLNTILFESIGQVKNELARLGVK